MQVALCGSVYRISYAILAGPLVLLYVLVYYSVLINGQSQRVSTTASPSAFLSVLLLFHRKKLVKLSQVKKVFEKKLKVKTKSINGFGKIYKS